jgi:hypothetical protein
MVQGKYLTRKRLSRFADPILRGPWDRRTEKRLLVVPGLVLTSSTLFVTRSRCCPRVTINH